MSPVAAVCLEAFSLGCHRGKKLERCSNSAVKKKEKETAANYLISSLSFSQIPNSTPQSVHIRMKKKGRLFVFLGEEEERAGTEKKRSFSLPSQIIPEVVKGVYFE